jgi:hypothetical protein
MYKHTNGRAKLSKKVLKKIFSQNKTLTQTTRERKNERNKNSTHGLFCHVCDAGLYVVVDAWCV